MFRSVVSRLALTAILLWPGATSAQVVVGQMDDFQDGTTQNWKQGSAAGTPPVNVNTGGPNGAGDNYLLITSHGGGGADSKLVVFNQQQWATTYDPAVTGIGMDLDNLGTTPLTIRVAFQDVNGNEYSTAGFDLPTSSGWQHAQFSLTNSDMTPLFGATQPFSTALADGIVTMRILDAASPAFSGDPIAAQLGVDNVTAVAAAVPEPGSLALLALAGLIGGTWRRVRAYR